jgi:hypothetical protein
MPLAAHPDYASVHFDANGDLTKEQFRDAS